MYVFIQSDILGTKDYKFKILINFESTEDALHPTTL